jgi:4-carboxymuconolactone decarboxylase
MTLIPEVQELSSEVMAILSQRIAKDNGNIKSIYRILANQPDLMKVFCDFSDVLNRGGRLSAAQREVAIVRTSFRTGARYEGYFHLIRARAAGLTDVEIEQLQVDDIGDVGTEFSVILRAADELCASNTLTPHTLTELDDAGFTPDLVVELIFLVGFYRMLSGIVNSSNLDAEAKEIQE